MSFSQKHRDWKTLEGAKDQGLMDQKNMGCPFSKISPALVPQAQSSGMLWPFLPYFIMARSMISGMIYFIMEHHGTLPCFNHLQPEVQTLPIGRPVSWHQAPVAIRHVKGVCSKGKHCLQRFAGNDFHWQNHANAHQMHIFNN
jgi:hypothetical protein